MLDTRQFLLTKLAEECNEVAQRALKQQQFGRNEKEPGQDKTNSQRLLEEIVDLETIVDMLEKIGEIGRPTMIDVDEMIATKRTKIAKYHQYSQKLGFVESI
jgi:NTP pyrophosphatase (non-canonical NTP hydrolase)